MGQILKEKWNYPDFVSRSTQPLCQGAANLLGHIISPSDYLKYDFFGGNIFFMHNFEIFFHATSGKQDNDMDDEYEISDGAQRDDGNQGKWVKKLVSAKHPLNLLTCGRCTSPTNI